MSARASARAVASSTWAGVWVEAFRFATDRAKEARDHEARKHTARRTMTVDRTDEHPDRDRIAKNDTELTGRREPERHLTRPRNDAEDFALGEVRPAR